MPRKSNKTRTIICILVSLAFILVSSGVSLSYEELAKEKARTGWEEQKKTWKLAKEKARAGWEREALLKKEKAEKEALLKKQKEERKRKKTSALAERKKKELEEQKKAAGRAEKKRLAELKKQRLREEREREKTERKREKELRKKKKAERKAKKIVRKPTVIPREKRKLTLEKCIEIAMENHTPLIIAKKQLRLAEFRLLEARRKLGPTVTAKWEESKGRVQAKLYTGEKYLIEAKQPIFYGGELVFSVKQAKTNLEIVRNDYDRIKNELILQVNKGYYSLDKAHKALRIQKKLEKRTKELYDMTKAGYEAGVIAQVEFLKVSSQYNQINFQVISAEEDISIANLLLQQAMNITEDVEIIEVKEPRIVDLDLEDCYDLAYLNRPEIKISQLSLEYFGYEKKIREARANWPRVDFLGSYGNTVEDYVKDNNPGEVAGTFDEPRNLGPEYYIGTKISLPIWGSTLGYSYTEEEWQPVVSTTHGTEAKTHTMTLSFFNKLEDISGVKEADLEYMRSQEEMNKRKQEITLEVKETFFKYKKAILLMGVSESKVEFQAKQVEILDIRRELGEAQFSDVIEEMIKLAEEEFSYIQAISDYYISIATLNKAVGIDGYFGV